MRNTTTTTKERSAVNENVSVEINRVGVYTVTATSALIGSWAVACLFSGMISSSGPLGLIQNYISAITG